MPIFVKTLSWRVPGNLPWLTALALSTGLSGCASLDRYEQSLAPPPPHPAPAPPAAALREAEARGYDEGLAAGKRIQARHDHAVAQAAQEKAATAASVMAQEAIQETQDMQTIHKLCDPPQPITPPGAAAAPATRASGPDVFAPSGPARPLDNSPDPLPDPF
ncbi:hypothetical protein [Acidocella sp.]|jgi:hypothetical protein|uniref:hypothetical protein n=1 Tax=Acidocella sp. TaxID=50710 RepID=UPI002F41C8E9